MKTLYLTGSPGAAGSAPSWPASSATPSAAPARTRSPSSASRSPSSCLHHLPGRAGRQHLQRRGLHLDGIRRPQARSRLPDRPADRDDDAGGHLRLAHGAHLHHRLHGHDDWPSGSKAGLPALLQLHLAVHLLDADAGHEQQLRPAVLRLGGGGPGVLPADRFLVHAADGDLRQPQGLPGQPRRRLRLPARHRPDRRLCRQPRLRRQSSPSATNWPR
jgi:hypothetical protein